MTQHHHHNPSEEPTYPVVAKLDHDGNAHPFPDAQVPTGPIGPHFAGRMTQLQFRNVVGAEDPTPYLGYLLMGPEGPFLYRKEQLAGDLAKVAHAWSSHAGREFTAISEFPADADGLTGLLDHMMYCLDRDDLSVYDGCVIAHLESLTPESLATMLVRQE